MKRYGFIFARGGSRGVPGKNIRPLGGKPLIAHAIDTGRASGLLDEIIVSTDSEEIAAVARQYGARTPFLRPAELAQDNSPEWKAWQHAVSWLHEHGEPFDVFVSLPATAPLRLPEDVATCIKTFEEGNCDLVVTCSPAQRHPMFNMYRLDDEGYAHVYAPANPPIIRRQDAPEVFDGTTMVYVSCPRYILNNAGLWSGKVKAVPFPRERALDIDDELDFLFAEMLLSKRGAHHA